MFNVLMAEWKKNFISFFVNIPNIEEMIPSEGKPFPEKKKAPKKKTVAKKKAKSKKAK
jgi:hypothetical protein